MSSEVLLDAGAVSRCRRRVHLDHDPTMADAPRSAADPAGEQRKADAQAHRRAVADRLAHLPGWTEIPPGPPHAREQATVAALDRGAPLIWGAVLPADRDAGRRGGAELLVRTAGGYVPVLVVRHKVTDPGEGARTTELPALGPERSATDPARKVRPQPRDQMRLAHLRRMLEACGYAEPEHELGGAIGLQADVVVWHDLRADNWPGGRCALDEYDARFADRLAIASAAAERREPLAHPSRILECRTCPWWPTCEAALHEARDVSLVVRGEDAGELRAAGITTVDDLAGLDPHTPVRVGTAAGPADGHPRNGGLRDGGPGSDTGHGDTGKADTGDDEDAERELTLGGMSLTDAVALARAWQNNLTVVRKVPEVSVPRADVEVDVDMESFGDGGAYLWGCLLSGVDVGWPAGYYSFATWEPVPTVDEARSFAEFWTWLRAVRTETARRGLSFRAYCYNEMAENRWMFSSTERFAGRDGVPGRAEVSAFVRSEEWVDLFQSVNTQFLCAHGKGLKVLAPVAGFAWRDGEAGGENSMRWYRDAVGMDGYEPVHDQRERLLRYNEDDVRATYALREWMCSESVRQIPYLGDL